MLVLLSFLLPHFSFSQDDSPKISLGGALRYNYNYSDWIEESNKLGGQLGYDVFRLNAQGEYRKLSFNAEYRFYAASSGGGMLKHGWIGYHFTPEHQLQFGLNIVPFGIQPYNSNNWFFNINYYIGLEDDADMGLKYMYETDKLDVAVAFYKNSDILDFHTSEGLSPSRYSYDITGRNLRAAYRFGETLKSEIGLSGQVGGVYNIDTQEMGGRIAFALHYKADLGNLNLKAQYTSYNINPKNSELLQDGSANPEFKGDWVEMGAYGANYNVASKADTYTLGVAYNLKIKNKALESITFYNDFGMIDKRIPGMEASFQNVSGMLFTMGPIYTYLDYAMGKNHAWLGGDWTGSFAEGEKNAKWNARLNLNVGYYF